MKPETDNNIPAVPTSPAQGQSRPESSAQRRLGVFLMSFGLAGAAMAALCCMAPFLLAGIFAAVGFGLLLNDWVLMGLVVLILVTAASGYGMLRGRRPRGTAPGYGGCRSEVRTGGQSNEQSRVDQSH